MLKGRSDRLRAFCSITIDEEFVVHDLRVIEGSKAPFVAMPSRKLSDNCPRCGGKNHLRDKFWSECGAKLDEGRSAGARGRDKLHVDVAHPIDPGCRALVQSTVLSAYEEELKRSEQGLEPSREYERDEQDEGGEDPEAMGSDETEPAVLPEPERQDIQQHEVAELPDTREVDSPDSEEERQEQGNASGFGDGIL